MKKVEKFELAITALVFLLAQSAMGMKLGTDLTANANGKNAQFPATMSYVLTSGAAPGRLCTGCRIGPNQYLTAAHCMASIVPANTTVDILSGSRAKITGIQMKSMKQGPGFPFTDKDAKCVDNGHCMDLAVFELSANMAQSGLLDFNLGLAAIRYKGAEEGKTVTHTGAGCKNPVRVGDKLECHELTPGATLNNWGDGVVRQVSDTMNTYGYPKELGALVGFGTESYISTEGVVALGPGDSGGCAYDPEGYVVGVNSKVIQLDDNSFAVNYIATLRLDEGANFVKDQLNKECVPSDEGDTRVRCIPPPKHADSVAQPTEAVYIVKINQALSTNAVYAKMAETSYCGFTNASSAIFEALVTVQPAPACAAAGTCAQTFNTGNKCGDYL